MANKKRLDCPTNACRSKSNSTPTRQSIRKYKGIVFTNKDGNIINDDNDLEQENIEITGVANDNEEMNDINTK